MTIIPDRIRHAATVAFHILRGKDFFFARVIRTKPDGIDYHSMERLPDIKIVRDTFIASIAGDVVVLRLETQDAADADIERMVRDVEGKT